MFPLISNLLVLFCRGLDASKRDEQTPECYPSLWFYYIGVYWGVENSVVARCDAEGGRAHVPQRARRPLPIVHPALPCANTQGIVQRTVGAFIPPSTLSQLSYSLLPPCFYVLPARASIPKEPSADPWRCHGRHQPPPIPAFLRWDGMYPWTMQDEDADARQRLGRSLIGTCCPSRKTRHSIAEQGPAPPWGEQESTQMSKMAN